MKKRVMSVLCVVCVALMLSGCKDKEELKAPSDEGVSSVESQNSDVSEENSSTGGESTPVSSGEKPESSNTVQTESSSTTGNTESKPAEASPVKLGSTDISFADGTVFKTSWTGKEAEEAGWVCDIEDYMVNPKSLGDTRPTFSKGGLSILTAVYNNDDEPKSVKECQICAIDADVFGASLCGGAIVVGTTTSAEADRVFSPLKPEQMFQNSYFVYLTDGDTVYRMVYNKGTGVVSEVGITVRTKSGELFA